MQIYIVRQVNEGRTVEDSSVTASFNHKSDAIRLSDSLKRDYPALSFPWFMVEADPALWHALYEPLRTAEPLDSGGL